MATRNLTSAVETELEASSCKPLVFAELTFADSTYRFWNGRFTKSWDSEDWLGAGLLLRAAGASETLNQRSTGVAVTLEGVSGVLLSITMNQVKQNQAARIWLGFEASGSVVADPYLSFRGYLDSWEIDKSEGSTLITLFYESHLAQLDRVSGQRFTNETQKVYYPDDVGFQFVTVVESWSGYWGAPK